MRGPVVPFILLLVFFPAGVSGQTLTVSSQQISLAAPAGALTPVTQTISVAATAPSVAFAASVRYLGATEGWLSATPASGTLPATLTITADASRLAPGTYLGQVTITAGLAGAYVNVLFTVSPGGSGGSFIADPSLLTFSGQPGVPVLAAQTITVTTANGSPAAFTAFASSSGIWLSVSPSSGQTPATLNVVAIQTGLSPGTHNGTITISPAGGGAPTVVPVVLTATGDGAATGALTLSQPTVTINHQFGTAAPSIQSVNVYCNLGYRPYTASTSFDWIRLVTTSYPTPSSSVTNQTFLDFGIQIDPTGLSPGSYAGSVVVTSAGLPTVELPVKLTITSTPALNAYPSSVQFDYTGTALSPFPITVTSTGLASLSFTATVPTSVPWLSVSPSSGSTSTGSQLLYITVSPVSLGAGTYTANVVLTILGSGATSSIPIVLNVSGTAATNALNLSTQSVDFVVLAGSNNPSQTIDVMPDPIGSTHSFTVATSSTGGWLMVSPFSATAPARITVTANLAALSGPGKYAGSIIITSLLTGARTALPVTLAVIPLALSAAPASLQFIQQQQGTNPSSQTIQITANTAGTYTASASPDWIKVTPRTGPTPATLTVSVDATGLPPGPNSGSIQITGPNNQVTVNVILMVAPPPAPTATPDSLTFTYQLGNPAPLPQPINIGSTGGALSFTTSVTTESGAKWLSVAPASGSTPLTVTVSVNPALVVQGKTSGTITITPSDATAVSKTVSVSLVVTAAPLAVREVLHAATFAPTAIAPGQIVTISGTGLGPVSGATGRPTSAGAFDTRLGDVRVLFDGIAAPLLYVSIDQINAIVPYAVAGRLSARIQVEGGGGFSIPIEAKVIDAAPGIFTTGGMGRGQAAAVNTDLTVNSGANPAPRGSVIMFFGTGEGQTSPPGQDGRVISTDLRKPLLPVTAKIGGRTADVTYAGSAPGLVSGVLQINVRIPDDVDVGTQPVEIQVGAATTQAGVTIVVR